MRAICAQIFFALVLVSSVTSNAAQTQQPVDTPVAPVPAPFVNAKKVFVANGAGDNDPEIAKYTNGPDGLYNQFYADVKALGKYEIVASPSDADIVLELRVDYPPLDPHFTYPKFRAEVRDPKTNVLLWTCTEPLNGAFLVRNGRKNIAQSLSKLADDLKRAASAQ